MARYFVFMFIEDQWLRDYLNLAIFLLNPQERWPAHVTIAGPFERPLEVPRSLRFVQDVSILGRGRFENGTRHTVFLHVGSRDMSAHMEKPDYPGAIPHLTLYSGRDRQVADALYAGLDRVRCYGVFHSKRLEVVSSTQQYNFNFRLQVRPDILSATQGATPDELRKLSKSRRVSYALSAIETGLHHSLQKAANPLVP